MREHTYKFKQIVVGGNLTAMIYAFKHGYPIIYKSPNPPHKFDTLYNGFSKKDIYESCCLLLSLSGLMLVGDKAESIRLDKDLIKVSTSNARLIRIEYDKLFIFEEEQIDNLPMPTEQSTKQFQVIDWFNVRSGMRHEHDKAESNSDFVKTIHFYPSDRIDGNHDKKDLAAISYIAEEQLDMFEYSPTYVRFKVEKMMKNAGIRGTRNGKNPLYPEKSNQPYKYRSVKIEPDRREIVCLTRDKYSNTDKLKFMHLAPEDILNSKTIKNNNRYLQKLQETWKQAREILNLST